MMSVVVVNLLFGLAVNETQVILICSLGLLGSVDILSLALIC